MGKTFISFKENNLNLSKAIEYIRKRINCLCVEEASQLNYFDLSEVDFNLIEDIQAGTDGTNKTALILNGFNFVIIENLSYKELKEAI